MEMDTGWRQVNKKVALRSLFLTRGMASSLTELMADEAVRMMKLMHLMKMGRLVRRCWAA